MPFDPYARGPYDPCYCQSGKQYKFCHHPIDSAPANAKRELSQKLYVERWGNSSDYFNGQGCYSWMASLLAPYSPQMILDIGCGSGTGILALKAGCKSNPRIISCDDNLECLQAAQETFKKCGLDAKVIRRMKQSAAGEKYHKMQIEPGKLDIPIDYADIILIEADVIWDTEFLGFLKTRPKFDAITVWLIGTYDLKPQCRNLASPVEGPIYRLTVQNRVYELANQILRVGGVLQVVDRGESPKEDFLKQDTIQSHKEQAAGTSMEVVDLQYRDYEKPPAGEGVSMITVLGTSGRMPKKLQLAVTSVISVKR